MKKYLLIAAGIIGLLCLAPKAHAAIALDTSVNGGLENSGTSTLSYSHTVTGTNPILFVGVFGAIGSDLVTGVTYNSTSMTLAGKAEIDGDRWVYLFYLVGPATGSHTVKITASANTPLDGQSASYTGVAQSGQPDAVSSSTIDNATSTTLSLTTIANNSWAFLLDKTNVDSPAAGAGSTQRQSANGMGIFDSNGPVTPAGVKSMTATDLGGGGSNFASVMMSFSPFVAPAPSPVPYNTVVTMDW
jgi:hypothetical protein